MKTNVLLKVNGQKMTVKLDSKKFPYIVLDNEKIIIGSLIFPRTVTFNLYRSEWMKFELELISGKEELEKILENPDLTCDKLSLKQSFMVA